GPRLRRRDARWARLAHRSGRHERLRRPATATGDRPGDRAPAEDPRVRRLVLGPRPHDRRPAAPGAVARAAGCDQDRGGAARLDDHGCRQDRGPRGRRRRGRGHARGAARIERDLQGDRRVAAGGGRMTGSTDSGARGADRKTLRRERMVAARAGSTPPGTTAEIDMTAAEKEEAELAEKARLEGGGMFDGPAPGKADHFGPSFRRMLGLLKPSAAWFVLVSIFGAIGVVLTVAAPKILGEATNIVYEGFISKTLGDNGFPPGMSQEQVVDGLRQANQGTFADMVAAMDDFSVGDGVDFERLRWIILAVMARSEEHTSELQSRENLVCRLLLAKK